MSSQTTTTRAASPLEAFTGGIVPTKTGILYKIGLAVVAFTMVLLPLIYLTLVALAAWSVLWHLKSNLGIVTEGRGAGIGRVILYLGPAVAGGILVFFMVKPFFAAKPKTTEPISLDPAAEPLLYEFVKKICGLINAPVPCRIDVDCQVNASASLSRGLWSKDLVLTVGLPLASGLNMRDFAGVLAHEFGHFAQGAGMRMTYIIRKINFWFARVVYERDEWDLKLEQAAKGSDWRIAIVLQAGRGCVWLTRRILWALMHVGHAISCFMLRQMEYDADSYEAKLAGSDAFESTASNLRLLNAATQIAYQDVQQSWTSSRLPENLPLLIQHKATSMPPDVFQKISAAATAEKTGWFDTHPCDTDRTHAVRRLNEPGVFRVSESATGLFADFTALSKRVTRHQYEKHFQLEFTEKNLMSSDEILRESNANAEADAMCRKYYGNVNISIKSLLSNGELSSFQNGDLSRWREARTRSEKLREEAEKLSGEWLEHETRCVALLSAHCLTKASFKLNSKEFGLPEDATSPNEQETAARLALNEASTARADRLDRLEPFLAALSDRITLGLRWTVSEKSNADRAKEMTELARLLAAVGAELPRTRELGAKLPAFTMLIQNRQNHSHPDIVDKAISDTQAELRSLMNGIQQGLKSFSYPFPHARGQLSVVEYARSEKPSENDWQRTYLDGDAHVDRLFALHYRLVGKLLAHADSAEKALESAQN